MVKNFLRMGTRDRLRLVIFVLLFVGAVLLWPILFCAKVDGDTSASWVALWTPLWIYNALGEIDRQTGRRTDIERERERENQGNTLYIVDWWSSCHSGGIGAIGRGSGVPWRDVMSSRSERGRLLCAVISYAARRVCRARDARVTRSGIGNRIDKLLIALAAFCSSRRPSICPCPLLDFALNQYRNIRRYLIQVVAMLLGQERRQPAHLLSRTLMIVHNTGPADLHWAELD